MNTHNTKSLRFVPTALLIAAIASSTLALAAPPSHEMGNGMCSETCMKDGSHMSKRFEGPKANTGTVTHTMVGAKHVLTLSTDFVIPETPAPHWQVVDSKGNTYLLQRLKIKGDKENRTIELPSYIPDVAKVQIWCAWAETVLGETTFDHVISTQAAMK